MAELVRIDEIEAMRGWVVAARGRGERVGVVPTMGALHEGHLSLVRAAASECDRVVATVFVNPTQFAPGEDYQRYPRDLARDAALLREAGADAMFSPTVEAMYPPGAATTVDVGLDATVLEGAIRPTHFGGVSTIVLKLFQITPADRAYFGQKDYQQTVVVRRMARDLNVPIAIVVCPTVREPDGLAMSSRNAYLTPDQRRESVVLHAALGLAERLVAEGERAVERLRSAVAARIAEAAGVELDYAEFVTEGTVTPVAVVDGPTRLVVAARVGATRLLDNKLLRGEDADADRPNT